MAVDSLDVLNWVIAPATAWTTAGRELGLFDAPDDDAPTGAEQRRADQQAARDKAIRQRRKKRGTDYPRGQSATATTLPAVDTSAAATIAASGPSDLLLYAAGGALLLAVLFSLGRR